MFPEQVGEDLERRGVRGPPEENIAESMESVRPIKQKKQRCEKKEN